MRIIVDYNKEKSQILMVKEAKYLGDFALRIRFNDGTE